MRLVGTKMLLTGGCWWAVSKHWLTAKVYIGKGESTTWWSFGQSWRRISTWICSTDSTRSRMAKRHRVVGSWNTGTESQMLKEEIWQPVSHLTVFLGNSWFNLGLWRNREDATKGGKGPWHKQARAIIPRMYEDICVKGLRLLIEDDVCEWEFSSFS